MKYDKIDQALFVQNRARFVNEMNADHMAVFLASDLMPRSADQHFTFRQNPDLFYLTGVDQEETKLILFPNSPIEKYKEVLFLRRTNDQIAVWEGKKLTIEEARETTGIQTIVWVDQFESIFNLLMNYAKGAYFNLNENDRAVNDVPYADVRLARETRERYPLHSFERCGPIMSKLRSVKSETELDLMQTACNITEKAFRHILDVVRPGVWEYEVEAELIRMYVANRGTGHAYSPIVASGANACVLHYVDNNCQCQDGDLLLIDSGAEYANYASDLTRTIPVNGQFTDRQRQVYQACLNVMKEAENMLSPGPSLFEYNEEVKKVMFSELKSINLVDKEEEVSKYFMHGIGHFIGIDVHDIGNRFAPIEEGMVFTIEPGIYIADEGIGVRIENNVVVKSGGNFDLMQDIPREVEEIETLMNAVSV